MGETAVQDLSLLDQYQNDGYHSLLNIARQHNGAFLCDGVGLGKTFVGLMLIERLGMYEKKRVVLFVPKSGRVPYGSATSRRYLPAPAERIPVVLRSSIIPTSCAASAPTARISRRSSNR